MVYTYTPTYYTSLHDSITSLCKSVLPFSFKKRRLPAIAAAEQQLSKQQSDNLKWQQDSFHQILNLMGLCKEGILSETEVSAFRTHLLETLIASPIDHEPTVILRDKLIFLQELFYAKCISEDEYHASKRPLLQRLAIQGAEIEARDFIVGTQKEASNEEWSVIDLKDEKCLVNQEYLMSKNKLKPGSTVKQIKGVASAFGFVSPIKNCKLKEGKDDKNLRPVPFGQNVSTTSFIRNEVGLSTENPFWNSCLNEKESETKSILMAESLPADSVKIDKRSSGDKPKKKPFKTLFQREGRGNGDHSPEHDEKEKKKPFKTLFQREGRGNGDHSPEHDEKEKMKSGKRQWGFDGFKKWKKNDSEDETVPLSHSEKSDGESYTGRLIMNPAAEGPDTKQIKRKLHPDGAPTDFFVDKVLGENIKKELSRIQTELGAKNPNFHLSDDQLEAISTRLPVDKADLKRFFPKSWCDRYGDIVLDVVRKEFKEHVGEMGNSRVVAKEKQNSKRWTTFDDDNENCHPNLFAPQEQATFSSSKMDCASIKYNPFFDV